MALLALLAAHRTALPFERARQKIPVLFAGKFLRPVPRCGRSFMLTFLQWPVRPARRRAIPLARRAVFVARACVVIARCYVTHLHRRALSYFRPQRPWWSLFSGSLGGDGRDRGRHRWKYSEKLAVGHGGEAGRGQHDDADRGAVAVGDGPAVRARHRGRGHAASFRRTRHTMTA